MYHKLSIKETLKSLDVNPETGLSQQEASFRLSGNDGEEKVSFFKIALSRITRPSVFLLLVAAALSLLFDGYISAVLIVSSMLVNVIFSSEVRRRALRKISGSVTPTVTHAIVLRNNSKMRISSDELVVGDIVFLKPGRVVPADLRLIYTDGLVINETALTGKAESIKDATDIIAGDVSPELRVNCAFERTTVIRGEGCGVVISTGMSTEISRLAKPLDAPEKETSPLLSRVSRTSKRISLFASLFCVCLLVINLLFGEKLLPTLAGCIALAIAVIPEGAALAALSALSKGAGRLTKQGFALREISALERLGSTSVYVTDLPTLGVAMTYTNGRVKAPHEEDTVPFIDGLLLCELDNPSLSAFASHRCDAAEVRSIFPKIGELTAEVTTTLHSAGKTTVSYTAGDAKEILSRSTRIWEFGKIRTLTDGDRDELSACIESFEKGGLSAYALGMRSGDDVPCDTELVFVGIAATCARSDESSLADVSLLKNVSVSVFILTSEDANRARLGADALKIPHEELVCGRDVDKMTDSDLRDTLKTCRVFAGLSPKHKTRIVHALSSMGKTVCAEGKTISDSALLEAADVSLCDFRSEDAIKSISDVIFEKASADRAIVTGNIARENISRAVSYLCASNLAEFLCVALSVVCGFGFPLSPAMILLINLVTDFFPATLLANGKKIRRHISLSLLFILGTAIGVVSAASFAILANIAILAPYAELITAGFLVVAELIILLPAHLSGGKKNVN